MEVQLLTAALPLAHAECEHGRQIGHNLSAGMALHLDDASSCRSTGLGPDVDAELVSRDALSGALKGVLDRAMARLEAPLLQVNPTGETASDLEK